MKYLFGILALIAICSLLSAGCVSPQGNATVTPTATLTPMATTPIVTETGTTMPTVNETPSASETQTMVANETGTTMPTVNETPSANETQTTVANETGTPVLGGQYTVSIEANGFTPGILEVPAGATVTWVNNIQAPETVTATGAAATFDSGLLQQGESFNHNFTAPDNYTYMSRTSGFTGEIVVTT
jgi:plastocyanin